MIDRRPSLCDTRIDTLAANMDTSTDFPAPSAATLLLLKVLSLYGDGIGMVSCVVSYG